jgi:hypothetical protein
MIRALPKFDNAFEQCLFVSRATQRIRRLKSVTLNFPPHMQDHLKEAALCFCIGGLMALRSQLLLPRLLQVGFRK